MRDELHVAFDDLEIKREIRHGLKSTVHIGRWHQTDVEIKVPKLNDGQEAAQPQTFGKAAHCEPSTRPLQPMSIAQEWCGRDGKYYAQHHELIKYIRHEARLMSTIRHPNVLMLMGLCLERPCLITELCSKGSLADLLAKAHAQASMAAHMGWLRRLKMAWEIAKGILHLHNHRPKIVHGDLQTANILVNSSWHCKISEFGMASFDGDVAPPLCPAATGVHHLAPEVQLGGQCTIKSDVFAFGVILWELFTLQAPTSPASALQEKMMDNELIHDLGEPSGISRSGLEDYLELMRRCISPDPMQRPTFDMIVPQLRTLLDHAAKFRAGSPQLAPEPPPASERKRWGSLEDVLTEAALLSQNAVSKGPDTQLPGPTVPSCQSSMISSWRTYPPPAIGTPRQALVGPHTGPQGPSGRGRGRLCGSSAPLQLHIHNNHNSAVYGPMIGESDHVTSGSRAPLALHCTARAMAASSPVSEGSWNSGMRCYAQRAIGSSNCVVNVGKESGPGPMLIKNACHPADGQGKGLREPRRQLSGPASCASAPVLQVGPPTLALCAPGNAASGGCRVENNPVKDKPETSADRVLKRPVRALGHSASFPTLASSQSSGPAAILPLAFCQTKPTPPALMPPPQSPRAPVFRVADSTQPAGSEFGHLGLLPIPRDLRRPASMSDLPLTSTSITDAYGREQRARALPAGWQVPRLPTPAEAYESNLSYIRERLENQGRD
eukprot:jgi/Botrbrau1/21122/Bobra.0061s0017.1